MASDSAFSYRSARSPAVMSAIGAVVLIESVAVHFAVASRHPRVAWALTLGSVAALVWLVRDYLALGSGFIRLEHDALHLRVGKRFDDLPTPGTNEGRDYLNLTKPAAPNVLIVLDVPQRIRLTVGIHRDVRRVALKLDDPEGFLRTVDAQRAALAARPT